METSEAAAAHPRKDSVKVAVNIRPLIAQELQGGCTDCVSVTPGEPQVRIGPHVFTFDHVYGSSGLSSSLVFKQCVHPLIDALFSGYNATVLAYGQTGSGKTYTMGTDLSGEANFGGIISQVMDTIFSKDDSTKDGSKFLIRVSFVEIFKEDVFDLLDANQTAVRLGAGSMAKASAPGRVPIHIRETAAGGITLAGVTKAEVKSKKEMASCFTHGLSLRATASTNMNRQSSRSHAIFTIYVQQKRTSGTSDKSASSDYDIPSSKFHLVDLAGSEKVKRTGADGLRLKEGIQINKGLLALGNVISALGDKKKRKEGAFVPYRDSKLTRLLQDSLGGNSKTVMIACISPADINKEETINTLKYAKRARNIQNKPVVNRDPATAEIQKLRNQLEPLRCSGNAVLEELQKKVCLLEINNFELNNELKERELSQEQLAKKVCLLEIDNFELNNELKERELSQEQLAKKVCLLEIDNFELNNELKERELSQEQLEKKVCLLEINNFKLNNELKERELSQEQLAKMDCLLEINNFELNNELKERELSQEQLAKKVCPLEINNFELNNELKERELSQEQLAKKVCPLEINNFELNNELKERELSREQLGKRAQAAQLERDQLMLKIETMRNGKSWDDIENADSDQQLESGLMGQNYSNACGHSLHDQLAMEQDIFVNELGSGCEVTPDASSEVDEVEKEREHSSMEDQLDEERQELDKRLQQKESSQPCKHFVDISSDSEHSDELESAHIVYISSDSESTRDGSDSDWVPSNRKVEEHKRRDGCACSKSSSCKTNKCECRGSGAQCGAGCGCKDSKCSNRDSSTKEKANQGAMLLQNVFSEKEAQYAKPRMPLSDIGNNAVNQTADRKKHRKKLPSRKFNSSQESTTSPAVRASTEAAPRDTADIPFNLPGAMSSGTPAVCSQVNQTADRKKHRKKLPSRKFNSSQESTTSPAVRASTEAAPRDTADIPFNLPGAMSSGTPAESNPPPLTDRNAGKPGQSMSTGNKESTGTAATRPPS